MGNLEILVFEANSRKAAVEISSLIPEQCFTAFQKRFGAEAARKVRKVHGEMSTLGMDLAQFKIGGRRIRLKAA